MKCYRGRGSHRDDIRSNLCRRSGNASGRKSDVNRHELRNIYQGTDIPLRRGPDVALPTGLGLKN